MESSSAANEATSNKCIATSNKCIRTSSNCIPMKQRFHGLSCCVGKDLGYEPIISFREGWDDSIEAWLGMSLGNMRSRSAR